MVSYQLLIVPNLVYATDLQYVPSPNKRIERASLHELTFQKRRRGRFLDNICDLSPTYYSYYYKLLENSPRILYRND